MTFPVTVAEFRERVNTDATDDAIQDLLDAAEESILARYPAGSGTEIHDGGQSYIFLRHRATSITTITEHFSGTDVELDPEDFRLRDDGVSVLRLDTGPNRPTAWSWASPAWSMPVTVEYEIEDYDAELARVQVALVELDLNAMPGLTSETIGAWSEQANSGIPYATEREAILASLALTPAPGFA
jgi:hypothetical protein